MWRLRFWTLSRHAVSHGPARRAEAKGRATPWLGVALPTLPLGGVWTYRTGAMPLTLSFSPVWCQSQRHPTNWGTAGPQRTHCNPLQTASALKAADPTPTPAAPGGAEMCSSQINISDQTDSSGSNVTFLKMQIGNTASHRQGDRGHRAGRGDRRSGRRGQRARRPWSAGLTARRRFSPCVVESPGRAWGTTATTCVSRRRILPPTGRASPGTPLGGRGQLPWPLHGAVPGTPPRH